tara:strand:- start:25 stop:363 length:339 start_codon:yes stop_codon:yes gene_type:complete
MEIEKQPKTDLQRSAIHVWFRQVADHLNNEAIDRTVVLEELSTRGIDIQWSEQNFKEVWKGVQEKMIEKDSTEDLSTVDFEPIYQGLCIYFSQQHGVALPPFPSRHNQGLDE